MDEILIDEKRYISSKQAAKLTGYAKDYIGQLCREGRVPARLVGRSWYVLESAIQDHRFGSKDTIEKTEEPKSARPIFSQTWESPRYEAAAEEPLPIAKPEQTQEEQPTEKKDAAQYLQDSWREWFDRIARTESKEAESVVPVEVEEKEEPGEHQAKEEKHFEIEKGEVSVPVHTVYELPPETLLPAYERLARQEVRDIAPERETYGHDEVLTKGPGRAVKTVFVTISAIAFLIAVINSGIIDRYLISFKQVSYISGTIIYNK